MLRVGLTGGIGSGKSTVAAMLARRGAVVIDADAIAREIVEPGTPALAEIAERWPATVVEGRLDRGALGAIVFASSDDLGALNAITHPRIAAVTAARMAAAPEDAVVVYDMPLLVEGGLTGGYDLIVVVDADDDVRLDRLVVRGLERADALRRMAVQATREERLAAADVIVDNNQPLVEVEVQVDSLWQRLLGMVSGHPSDHSPSPKRG